MTKTGFIGGLILTGILLSASLTGQNWNAARLSLLYGGSIPFNFNSIKAYSEGIEIVDGTILGITLTDNNEPGHDLEGFDLTFKTFNGQTAISGAVNDLPLNVIRVKAENNLGLGAGTTTGYQDLDAASTILFSYTSIPFSDLIWDTHQLSLSYECGKPLSAGGNGRLLGKPPDYYMVEIEVELIPTGPGF
ncbi:MAG: hypothetical protein K9G38_07110 [Bacteroidales bacterium]|nr:hypothetical protein [Bacteroidales bacterium]